MSVPNRTTGQPSKSKCCRKGQARLVGVPAVFESSAWDRAEPAQRCSSLIGCPAVRQRRYLRAQFSGQGRVEEVSAIANVDAVSSALEIGEEARRRALRVQDLLSIHECLATRFPYYRWLTRHEPGVLRRSQNWIAGSYVPRSLLIEGVEMARLVADLPHSATFGSLMLGDEVCGSWIRGDRISGRHAGVSDLRVADAARSLATAKLSLPRIAEQTLPITALGKIGLRGPLDRSIGNRRGGKDQAGPFEVFDPPGGREAWQTFAYPTLWGHDHTQETRMEVLPDTDAAVKVAADGTLRKAEADGLWDDHAARLHFNRDFQLNSQPLAACLTPEKSLGGRAWPTVRLTDLRWQYATVLWHNTTPGLLLWWLIASRQQSGRATLTVSRLPDLPTLDCRGLTDSQHRYAKGRLEGVQGEAAAAGQRGIPRRDPHRPRQGRAGGLARPELEENERAIGRAPSSVVQRADRPRRPGNPARRQREGRLTCSPRLIVHAAARDHASQAVLQRQAACPRAVNGGGRHRRLQRAAAHGDPRAVTGAEAWAWVGRRPGQRRGLRQADVSCPKALHPGARSCRAVPLGEAVAHPAVTPDGPTDCVRFR